MNWALTLYQTLIKVLENEPKVRFWKVLAFFSRLPVGIWRCGKGRSSLPLLPPERVLPPCSFPFLPVFHLCPIDLIRVHLSYLFAFLPQQYLPFYLTESSIPSLQEDIFPHFSHCVLKTMMFPPPQALLGRGNESLGSAWIVSSLSRHFYECKYSFSLSCILHL